MDNLEYLISGLGQIVVASHRILLDINKNCEFEFLDGQKKLCANTIYISPFQNVMNQLENCIIEPGATLMISGAKNDITPLPWNTINVVLCSCNSGRLYNQCVRILKERFSSRQLFESDTNSQSEQIAKLWDMIRSRHLTTRTDIYSAWAKIVPDLIKEFYRISIITPDNKNDNPYYIDFADKIRQIIPDSVIVNIDNKNDEFAVIQFFDDQPFIDFPQWNILNPVLEKYHMHMLIGNSTRKYEDMNTVFRIYYRANYLANQLKVQKRTHVFYYENYAMFNTIDLCAQRFIEIFGHSDIIYLIDPSVIHITNYDREHNTNLRDVLLIYLINNKDLKKTSEYLYMHRNTVANKLNLIKKLWPIDFNNGFTNQRLIFSCQVIAFYEKVLNMAIPETTAD